MQILQHWEQQLEPFAQLFRAIDYLPLGSEDVADIKMLIKARLIKIFNMFL